MENNLNNIEVKGIIIAAGRGTRLLPITQGIPKELMPLGDRPILDFIVEELYLSGIRDICIITNPRKELNNFFKIDPDLIESLEKSGKHELIKRIRAYPDCNIEFINQDIPKGTAHAIFLAKEHIGNHPFIVAYPDDVVVSDNPLSRQIIDAYISSKGKNVIAMEYCDQDISRYGVVDFQTQDTQNIVGKIVEKPKEKHEIPSNFISIGRYLFTPEIFPIIDEEIQNGFEGELCQTSPINVLAKQKKVIGINYKGNRFDTGEMTAYINSFVRYVSSLSKP